MKGCITLQPFLLFQFKDIPHTFDGIKVELVFQRNIKKEILG